MSRAADSSIVILGAGINGCALARELTLAGCHVVLVDRADIASGATAYSSRLIHGGLRYLEYGELSLVRESLAERDRLLRLAPHLVKPLELFIPIESYWGGWRTAASRFLPWARASRQSTPQRRGASLVRTGLRFYDLFGRGAMLPRHAMHRAGDSGVPPLAARYRWLCSYHDAQALYPERLAMAQLRDAELAAAERGVLLRVFTYSGVTVQGQAVTIAPHAAGQLNARQPDVRPSITLQPAAVVNATGASVDRTLEMLEWNSSRLIGGTKGTHLFSFHAGLRTALGGRGVYAEGPDLRPIFVTPCGDSTLIGTTDDPYEGPPEDAQANDGEINYLLQAVVNLFPQFRLTRSDIAFHYSGVRPLPFVPKGAPAAVTRRHFLHRHDHAAWPFYSIIGGKLTTCRNLAEQAAATLLGELGRSFESQTRNRPLAGAVGISSAGHLLSPDEIRRAIERLAGSTKLPLRSIEAAWNLLGADCSHALVDGSTGELAESLLRGSKLPARVARWIVRHEHVSTLDDLVERRLMLLYDPGLCRGTLEHLAELLVDERLLADSQRAAAVDITVERLRKHYGRTLA